MALKLVVATLVCVKLVIYLMAICAYRVKLLQETTDIAVGVYRVYTVAKMLRYWLLLIAVHYKNLVDH